MFTVIGYHIGSRTKGGFLGVDVFFVLSGYLITSLLVGERMRSGSIDLARFWAHRARRLFPALLLLVASAAVVIALQDQVEDYAARRADLLSTLFYVANLHFINVGQSYFAQFQGVSPLEHMWSLSIEEQFYLAWPLLVLGLTWAARRRQSVLLIATGLAALASAAWMGFVYTGADPTRAYIGTDTRAHELLIGALLAIAVLQHPALLTSVRARRAAMIAGPVAALAVGAAFFVVSDHSASYYRGGAALFCVAVAVGLWAIETLPDGPVARALSWRPVVWVGTISYGLYLWHWPLVQWLRDPDLIVNSRVRQLVEVSLAFVIAAASFYLVERPIRRGRLPWVGWSGRRLALVTPVVFALVAGLSLAAVRVKPHSIEAQVGDESVQYCPDDSPQPEHGYRWCERVAGKEGGFAVATAGDSTSVALDPGMRAVARERGWRYVQAGINGCSIVPIPFPSDISDPASVAEARRCLPGASGLLRDVAGRVHPDLWIVSDRWMLTTAVAPDGRARPPEDSRLQSEIRVQLRRRLQQLTQRGAQVVMLMPIPGGPPVRCAKHPEDDACHSSDVTTANPQVVRGRRLIRQAVAGLAPAVVTVDVTDLVCPGGTCPAAIKGTLVRYDTVHYTATFSRRIVPQILDRARSAGTRLED